VDLVNGLRLTTDVAWHHFSPLSNSTDFSLLNRNKAYHANEVVNGDVSARTLTHKSP
jgi:hypothetical protein